MMKLKFVLITLLSLACGVVYGRKLMPREAQSYNCPVLLDPQPPVEATTRIVGGAPAGTSLASSIASIVKGSRLIGTGVLISRTAVAFSAFLNVSVGDKVFLGRQQVSSWEDDEETAVEVSSVTRHPSFDATADDAVSYAVAVLTLAFSAQSDATLVKVANISGIPAPNAIVRVVGYGSISGDIDYYNPGNVLRQVDIPLFEFNNCVTRYKPPGNWSIANLFCAGYKYGRCSDCFGDGPVLQYSGNDEPVLVGLLTSISSCGNSFLPNVYMRIGPLASFLPEDVERTDAIREVLFDGRDGGVPPLVPPLPTASVAPGQGASATPVPPPGQEGGNENEGENEEGNEEENEEGAEPSPEYTYKFPLAGIIAGAVLAAMVLVVVVIIIFVVRKNRS